MTHLMSCVAIFLTSLQFLTLEFLLFVSVFIIIMGSSASKQSDRCKASLADNSTMSVSKPRDLSTQKRLGLEPNKAQEKRSLPYENFDVLQKEYDSLSIAYQLKQDAFLLKAQYKYDISLEQYKKSMAFYEEIKGRDSSYVAGILIEGIGVIYNKQRKFSAALEAFQRANKIYKKNKGEEHQCYAQSLKCIGGVYLQMENYDQALQYFQQALVIGQQLNGKDSLDVGQTLQCIGLVYLGKGDYSKALQYLRKNIQIQQRTGVKDKIRFSNTHHNIGFTYYNQGDYQNALHHFQKSLQIKLNVKGPDSVDAAFAMMFIGNAYHSQNDLTGAVQMFKQSIAIYEKHQVKNRDYAGVHLNLGIVCGKLKNYELSTNAFRVCLQVFEQMECSADAKKSALGLARSLHQLGNQEQLEIVKKKYDLKL